MFLTVVLFLSLLNESVALTDVVSMIISKLSKQVVDSSVMLKSLAGS